jgi:hypothetical protein
MMLKTRKAPENSPGLLRQGARKGFRFNAFS